MPGLQIHAKRERGWSAAADAAAAAAGLDARPAPAPGGAVKRVLLLRLERIGDLLMTLDAIAAARSRVARRRRSISAVGSWNLPMARLIPGVSSVRTADVPWLAREGDGDRWPALVAKARELAA